MFNRVFLYISKNLRKMLSTFLMFVVMISLVGTLAYVYATVNTRVDTVDVVRHNYVVEMDGFYGDFENEKEYKSVDDLYEKMLSLDGLEAYKIDMQSFGGYVIVRDTFDLNSDFEETSVSFQIAHDEKQIDFVSGKVEIISGEIIEGSILISEKVAQNQGIDVGDSLSISTYDLMDYGEEFNPYEEMEIKYHYEHDFHVSGIYKTSEESSNMMYAEDVYIDIDTYNEAEEIFSEKVAEVYADDEYYSQMNMPEFERVLAQYDNTESAELLDAYVSDEYEDLVIIDSGKEIEKAKEPLSDFNKILLIILIGALVISFIGIYLNMFLKLDKRRSEFISLLAFGINSFKLSIQVFFEQFMFLLLSVPVAYFLVNVISKTVIEIVKMYYVVVIEKNMYESEDYFGSWLDYIYLDSSEVVEFAGVNLLFVILSVFAVMVVSLFILSITEVSRRYKNVKKV